jgi:tetratricopeptide (TPR) repeat protein
MRTPSLPLVLVATACLLTACGPVARHKVSATTQSKAEAARLFRPTPQERILPPATMSAAAVRKALWDISARQTRGDASKTLADYAERAEANNTLEARFLAAAAIPDKERSWPAMKAIAEAQPKFYWAHAGMAAVYVDWKLRDQCERELNFAFELGPDIPYTYTLRGNLYRAIGEHPLAVRDYQTALRADPADADARVGLALSRKALGQTQGLREELERALADLPTQYEAAESLANLLDSLAQVRAAREAWERVEKLSPRNRGAKLALARLRGGEDVDGAIRAYEDAGKIQPLSKVEEETLARLYRQRGRTDDEARALTTITKLDPKDLGPWRRLSEIAEASADLSRMEEVYNNILAIDPKDTLSLFGLGLVTERRALVRLAIEKYREAAAAGHPTAGGDATRLITASLVPDKPLAGATLTDLYRKISESLEKAYEWRRKEAPKLKGNLKVRVQTDGEGKVLALDVTENSLNDPWLEAHLYYAMQQAAWPKLKPTEPRKFSLNFDLPPNRE